MMRKPGFLLRITDSRRLPAGNSHQMDPDSHQNIERMMRIGIDLMRQTGFLMRLGRAVMRKTAVLLRIGYNLMRIAGGGCPSEMFLLRIAVDSHQIGSVSRQTGREP
jgi:hypothetical protein